MQYVDGHQPGASMAQVLEDLPDQPIATTRGRLWSGVTLDVHAPSDRYCIEAPARDHHVVIYAQHGTGRMFQRRSGSEHLGVIGPGTVILMPAGLDSVWDGSANASARIRVPTELIAEANAEIGARPAHRVELKNVFETHDPVIERVALILLGELDAPRHPAQALLVSSASTALAAHLLRRYGEAGSCEKDRGTLSRRMLAAVVSYVEACPSRSITLAELAGVAGVSRYHFSRMFKRTTGITPIAFVEQTRIRRAETLMRGGVIGLSDLALQLGFADQSHFTRRFRRHLGVTPAVYIRSLR